MTGSRRRLSLNGAIGRASVITLNSKARILTKYGRGIEPTSQLTLGKSLRSALMSPETFNRLQNTSKKDFERFISWLFSQTLAELRAARGDMAATRAAWIHYFRRGLAADLLMDELMAQVRELFH